MSNQSIETRADLSFIRYGTVWEDADILCRALAPVARRQRLLSIASAGGNTLALLSLDPREVCAVDLNPAQLACLDLRIAGFQALSHAGLLGFLGVTEEAGRLRVYEGLRPRLSPASRAFWDARSPLIEGGVIHAGKLERFLKGYRWALTRWVHSPARIDALLSERDAAGQASHVEAVWNSWRWRLLNRVAFSKRVLGRMGRDPEFFRHTGADVTSGPNRRLNAVLRRPKAHQNPYLTYHLTGNYAAGALPKYLRPQHFKALRARVGRVRLFQGKAEEAPGRFAGFNLSNIFEYMGADLHEQSYHALLAKARPGARLAYWNLHVERACPASARLKAKPLARLARGLHQQDQAWAYRAFHVDERL